MILRLIKIALLSVFLGFAAGESQGQPPRVPDPPERIPAPSDFPETGPRRNPRLLNGADPKDAMIAKLKAEQDKKDHKQMLDRGEEALKLANQLEAAFEKNKNLTPEDKVRLESLETVVEKIRKELGGNDDGDELGSDYEKPSIEERPSTMEEAFKFLHSTTIKLVDELKKTTRFSISAVAIRTSNSVLKIVKFLRLRK